MVLMSWNLSIKEVFNIRQWLKEADGVNGQINEG